MTRRHGREDGVERKLLQVWLPSELHETFGLLVAALGPDTTSAEFLRQTIRSLVAEGYALAPGVTLRSLADRSLSPELDDTTRALRKVAAEFRARHVVGTTRASQKTRRSP